MQVVQRISVDPLAIAGHRLGTHYRRMELDPRSLIIAAGSG